MKELENHVADSSAQSSNHSSLEKKAGQIESLVKLLCAVARSEEAQQRGTDVIFAESAIELSRLQQVNRELVLSHRENARLMDLLWRDCQGRVEASKLAAIQYSADCSKDAIARAEGKQ